MSIFILRRTAQMALVVLCVVALVFFLLRLSGDPARLMNAADASQEVIEATRVRLGLDQSVLVQFLIFLRGLFTGDLGFSFFGQYEVSQVVMAALPNTIMLGVVTIAVSTVTALVLGICAG